jgi:hypothetical protein
MHPLLANDLCPKGRDVAGSRKIPTKNPSKKFNLSYKDEKERHEKRGVVVGRLPVAEGSGRNGRQQSPKPKASTKLTFSGR